MMKSVALLSFVLFSLVGAIHASDANGAAVIQQFPYLASMEQYGKHVCSATIIDDLYVITTNSCISALDVKHTYVRVGTNRLGHRGQLFKATEFSQYKSAMSSRAFQVDLAMVKVASAFSYSSKVMWLNPNNNGVSELQTGLLPVWANSQKKGSSLWSTAVSVMTSSDCSAAYASSGTFNVTQTMYCLAPQSSASQSCRADVGTPFYDNEQLYGVVIHNPGCGTNLPPVILGIADYTSFIITILCDMASLFS